MKRIKSAIEKICFILFIFSTVPGNGMMKNPFFITKGRDYRNNVIYILTDCDQNHIKYIGCMNNKYWGQLYFHDTMEEIGTMDENTAKSLYQHLEKNGVSPEIAPTHSEQIEEKSCSPLDQVD